MPDPTNGKHDVWTHRIAVAGLVALLSADLSIMGYLAVNARDIPPALAMSGFTVLASMIQSIMKGKEQ